jgi:AcrR family transcriptional regulator
MTSTEIITPTRERLLDAALELFAERGFTETTVGDIEEAAGLVPRSGAMYKHFTSKDALLHAALDRFISQIAVIETRVFEFLPLGDMRAEATLLARTTMAHFASQRDFLRIVFQERARIPEVVQEMHRRAVAPAYAIAAAWVQRQIDAGLIAPCDADAVGAVLTLPFVGYRLEINQFGVAPGNVGEERFVDAWVDLVMAFAKGSKGDTDAKS